MLVAVDVYVDCCLLFVVCCSVCVVRGLLLSFGCVWSVSSVVVVCCSRVDVGVPVCCFLLTVCCMVYGVCALCVTCSSLFVVVWCFFFVGVVCCVWLLMFAFFCFFVIVVVCCLVLVMCRCCLLLFVVGRCLLFVGVVDRCCSLLVFCC